MRAGSTLRGGLIALFALSWATPAHAWTDALVQTARARVELQPSGRADVTLKLELRVRAGWLEALEIAGLDSDAQLTSDQVTFVSENGQSYRPTLRTRRERTQIRFDRRSAPRRGTYQITLNYATDLSARIAPTDDGIRVPWTMPGWQSGLEGVVVELVVPSSEAEAAAEDTTSSIETSQRREGDRTVLSWRRVHLPRTIPWTVAAELPPDALPGWSEHFERVSAPELPPEPIAEEEPADPFAAPLAIVLIALLSLASIRAFEMAARTRRARIAPWLGRSTSLRSLGVLLAAAGGVVAVHAHQSYAALGCVALIVLLTGQRRAVRKAPALGRWRAPIESDSDAEMPLMALRWLDGTRARGVLVWLTVASVVGWVHALDVEAGRDVALSGWLWACVCLPLMVASPRLIPPDPRVRLARARAFAQQLRVRLPGPAIALTVHESAHGEVQDARIRLITEARPTGLLRLDIAFDDAGAAYGIMLTRQTSDAEAQAQERCDAEALRGPGGRIVRVVSVEEAIRLARRFKPTPQKKKKKRTRRLPTQPARLHA